MPNLLILNTIVAGVFVLSVIAFLRVYYILPRNGNIRLHKRLKKRGRSHLVVVLGSGGHTAEMMSLLRGIDPRRYIHRTYIVSSGDNFSAGKASEIETKIQRKHSPNASQVSAPTEWNEQTGLWDVKVVPRARRIHQSLLTTPLSSLKCLSGCLQALREAARASMVAPNQYPDVIITNGPATAVIVILAAYLLKFFGIAPPNQMKVIYVESWARVKRLSLSGKVLLRLGLCHRFLVQWEGLANQINEGSQSAKEHVEWRGFLVE